MKIVEVINRATKDPKYAADLAAKASQVKTTSGILDPQNRDAWKELLKEFADGPEDLARLAVGIDNPKAGTTTTITTTGTITTAPCLFTTTTTTTTTAALQ
jgi:hypothetical protein